MDKCSSCVKNLRRYNGRQIECKDMGRRTQQVTHCDGYIGKVIKKVDLLNWTGVN